jgi:glycosyltransferase involved in cell wall biosynthesis
MRRAYRGADLVVANSQGLARDAARVAGVAIESIPVVRNPVITPDLDRLAAEPISHPWFGPDRPPILLGAGGFRRQKDFHTLLRAFARVRAERDVRLILLGRGRLEASLRRLAGELGVARHVDFPGFAENPYPFMKAAAVFVLSSRWEGSPNVLTEALALGTPAVATDCPSGPAETLQEGRVGLLVPIADPDAMAGAVLRTLAQPPEPDRLRAAVSEYTVAENARRYADLLQALVAQRAGVPGPGLGER